MQYVSELLEAQRRKVNGDKNKDIWGDILYNVKVFGAKGDGTTDDTAELQDAIDEAADDGGNVLLPPGTYITGSLTIPYNVTLVFSNGAVLSVKSGSTLTINGAIQAELQKIFSGSGSVSLNNARSEVAFPEWWGAVGDGVTSDTAAIQSAVNSSNILRFRAVVYYLGTSVSIPQGRSLQWYGAGFRNTVFKLADGIVGFDYLRSGSYGGTTWALSDIQISQGSLLKTSIGVRFKGIIGLHDNWIHITNCTLAGLQRGVELGYCGNSRFENIIGQSNEVCYFLNRDSSFIWFDSCFNLNNDYFIYADDPAGDGVSNGIFVNKCTSVFAAKIDIRIVGWQTVFITDGGYDLGGTADYQDSAMYFGKCQDVMLTNVWIASNIALSPNREGIELSDTHTVSIKGCSIVNTLAGIKALGNATFSTGMVIDGNKFENNTTNDVVFLGDITGSKVINNHSRSLPSRTGTNYEIYANTPGTDYNVIKMNTFRGTSFTIASGANSIINENIFGIGK